MHSRYNVTETRRILEETCPEPLFPPASDRDVWSRVRERFADDAKEIVAEAEKTAGEPVRPLPATLYLHFQRYGVREPFRQVYSDRRSRLSTLALAECFEHRGRFLDPIMDLIWAICEESSWANPAHQHVLADVRRPLVDLTACETSLALAEADRLVGDQLGPAVRKRIVDELERRTWTPYLEWQEWP